MPKDKGFPAEMKKYCDRFGLAEGRAFVRGINVYGRRRMKKEEMLRLCRKIEDENLRIIKVVKTDNIVFNKGGIHYAEVSLRLEGILSDYFKEKIYVTSRSMRTIKSLAKVGEEK